MHETIDSCLGLWGARASSFEHQARASEQTGRERLAAYQRGAAAAFLYASAEITRAFELADVSAPAITWPDEPPTHTPRLSDPVVRELWDAIGAEGRAFLAERGGHRMSIVEAVRELADRRARMVRDDDTDDTTLERRDPSVAVDSSQPTARIEVRANGRALDLSVLEACELLEQLGRALGKNEHGEGCVCIRCT